MWNLQYFKGISRKIWKLNCWLYVIRGWCFLCKSQREKLIALLKFFSLPLKRKHPKRKASSIPSIMIRGYLELHGHTANVGLVVRLGHFVWTKHAKVGNGRIVWVYQIDVYCLIMGHCILYMWLCMYILATFSSDLFQNDRTNHVGRCG